ncbi:MAG: ABC transporter ATP-binding protein [Halomonas sp.]
MANVNVWISLRRILTRSSTSARPLLLGLLLRVLERCCELMPYLLCYLWLCTILEVPRPGFGWAADPGWLALALIVSFVLQWLLAYGGQKRCFLESYRIIASYRERLIERMRNVPIGELRSHRVGQLADVLTDDINRVESIFAHVLADFVSALGLSLVALLVLASIEWRLALALAALVPLAALALVVSRRLFERAGLRKHALYRQTSGLLVEFIGGLTTLRLFHQADVWAQRLTAAFADLRRMSLSIEKWGGGPVMLFRFLVECGLLVLMLVGILSVFGGEISPVSWIAFFLLAYKFLGPLLEAAEYLVMLRHACQSEVKLEEAWALQPLAEPLTAKMPEHFAVSFDAVSFSHGGEARLRDISIEVPERSVTAIVGPSGAGKSTLLHLLGRFHDPDQGAVRMGEVDLREMGSEQLYKKVSAVFQQVQIFDGTIIENLRAGREDASDEDVRQACVAADCVDFIERLPEGYLTRVGESGFALSGGERQRLSVARALLKDAPVLLLDEVTAAVDPQSQMAIHRALNTLARDRTLIMVAHRLSTVRNADQIIVLDRGCIVESGKHDALLRCDGLYAAMWAAQATDDPVPAP